MNNKFWIVIVILVLVGAAGYYFLMNNNSKTYVPEDTIPQAEVTESVDTEGMEKVIQLSEQNESSESGTATLTESEGKVVVSLNLNSAPSDIPQPAHIHSGACPDVGAVAYPLTNVVNGVSVTTLDVTMADLAAKQPLAINVHKSVPEASVYISCGDLAL